MQISPEAKKAMMNMAMQAAKAAATAAAAAAAAKMGAAIANKSPVATVGLPAAPPVQTAAIGGYIRGTKAMLHKGERVIGVACATAMKGGLKRKPYKTVRVRKGTKARKVPASGIIRDTGLYNVRPGQYVIPK